MNFLDALKGLVGTAGTAYGQFTGADAKNIAAQQAAANEAARKAAAAAAGQDKTQTYLIIGGAVALVLVAVLAIKK